MTETELAFIELLSIFFFISIGIIMIRILWEIKKISAEISEKIDTLDEQLDRVRDAVKYGN